MAAPDLTRRLQALLLLPDNQECCDCSDRRPTWASLMVAPPNAPPDAPTIGAFCCMNCSGIHRGLGTHICFVRSVTLDEWKQSEVRIMEIGGNQKINSLYEAKSTLSSKPDFKADLATRADYIRKKYVERKFFSPGAYATIHESKEDDIRSNHSDRYGMMRRQSSMPVMAANTFNESHVGFATGWDAFPSPSKGGGFSFDVNNSTRRTSKKDDMSRSSHSRASRKKVKDSLSISWHPQSPTEVSQQARARSSSDQKYATKTKPKSMEHAFLPPPGPSSTPSEPRQRSGRSRSRSTGRPSRKNTEHAFPPLPGPSSTPSEPRQRSGRSRSRSTGRPSRKNTEHAFPPPPGPSSTPSEPRQRSGRSRSRSTGRPSRKNTEHAFPPPPGPSSTPSEPRQRSGRSRSRSTGRPSRKSMEHAFPPPPGPSSTPSEPRSRSKSRSSRRKPSRNLRQSVGSIDSTTGTDDSDSCTGDTPMHSNGSLESLNSTKAAEASYNSDGSLDTNGQKVVKSSSQYRKGMRRMRKGRRGDQARVVSVSNVQGQRSPKLEDLESVEKNPEGTNEDLISKLKGCLAADGKDSEEKIREMMKALEEAEGGLKIEDNASDGQLPSRRKSRADLNSSEHQRRRSSSRKRGTQRRNSNDGSHSSSVRRRARVSPRTRTKEASEESLQKDGSRKREESTEKKKVTRSDSSQSRDGRRRRERLSHDANANAIQRSEKSTGSKKADESSSCSDVGGPRSGVRSRTAASSRRNRKSFKSGSANSSNQESDMVKHSSSDQSSLSKSDHGDDDLSINTSMKPKVKTAVIKKQITKCKTWAEEDVELEFSDEDLFKGDPFATDDDDDDDDDDIDSDNEEKYDDDDNAIPARSSHSTRGKLASVPLTLLKEKSSLPPSAITKKETRQATLDLEALTFYD